MKRLLILAMLALGLCASPALAATIDFTKVDDAFIDALNSNNTSSQWGDTGSFVYYFDSTSGARINFGFYSAPNTMGKGWYKSANGISIDVINGGLELVFYEGYGLRSVPAAGASITFGAENVDAYLQIWYTATYFEPVTEDPYFNGRIDANGLATLNFDDFISPNSEWVSSFRLGTYYSDTVTTITLSSLTIPYYDPPAVPVPAAVWLLGTGVAGVAALRRKFK